MVILAQAVDAIEAKFRSCEHPYVAPLVRGRSWCPQCGSSRLGTGPWTAPKWRDFIMAGVEARNYLVFLRSQGV